MEGTGNDGFEAVLTVLRNASCQQPELIKPAEEQLQQWEKMPGFYTLLLQIYMNQSLETNVRWMAVLCFKNGVDKYWRIVSAQKISDEEKTGIRKMLLTLSCQLEPLAPLALQLAVVIGKVARQDCPSNWPELLPALMSAVTSHSEAQQHALLILHHVLKQMSSRRLIPDKRKFQEVASKLFPEIEQLFKVTVQQVIACNESSGGCDLSTIGFQLQRAHYCLKIQRKLAIFGFNAPSQVPEVAEFYSSVCEQIKVFLLFRKQHEGDALKAPAEKYTNLLMKCLLELLEQFPYCFLKYARTALEIVTSLAFSDDTSHLLYERITVQCLNLLKCFLDCSEYKENKFSEENKSPESLEADHIKSTFFTTHVLEVICHKLLTRYFLLSREDLEIWESDPEEFCTEVEGGDAWKFSLRPATEFLFRKMFHEFQDQFRPVILALLKDAIKMTDPNNFSGILVKDAVFNAIGLASYDLIDEIDFDDLFVNHLINELKVTHPNYCILRRRVIWLISQWIEVRLSPANLVLLYEAIVHLLSNDPDFVVRYHTALALKAALDDFQFDRKLFSPFLPTVFGLLFKLLKEAKECDIKMQVLNVMSVMIEILGSEVRPSLDPLVSFLPHLWQESEQHNLLRCAILTTLTYLVAGMGTDCMKVSDFLQEVLHLSTDTTQPSHIYLLEDGLQLWNAVIENTPSLPNPDNAELPLAYNNLLSLYSNLLPVLEGSTENIQICTYITVGYLLLCPRHFLHRHGQKLLNILAGQVSDLRNDPMVLLLRILDTIVQVLGREGAVAVQEVSALMAARLIKESESRYPSIVSAHLSVLSRIILADPDVFFWIVNELSKTCDESEEPVLTQLLRVWVSKMSVVGPDERRKLCALALCKLVSAPPLPAILPVWGKAVEVIVEAIYDVSGDDGTQDQLVFVEGENEAIAMNDDKQGMSSDATAVYEEDDDARPSWYEDDVSMFVNPECEHSQRRHALARRDPVHTVALRHCLGRALVEFQRHTAASNVMALVLANINDDSKAMMQLVTAELQA